MSEQMKKCDIKATKESSENQPADFEKAISATGYGKFNVILLLISLPCCICSVFDTTTISYILPSAECDLNLSLVDKGTLNAVTYGGMISSAFLWGFLSDTLGRKKLLVYGFFLDSTFNILCAFSQNVLAIMIFKFMGGFIICGPFAVLMTYLSEFHGLKHRSRVMIIVGIFFSVGNIMLPLLAWLILPQDWNWSIIPDMFQLHSWQIFLAVCSLPSLLSGIFVTFLPESPKFLMSKGKNDEALAVFRTIYNFNTGNDKNDFPIKELIDELNPPLQNKNKSDIESEKKNSGLRKAFSQLSIMFEKPHLQNSCLVYTIQFGILLGLNTFRLWVPQLFTIITEFENDPIANNLQLDEEATLCHMLAYKVNKSNAILMDLEDILLCETTTEGDMYLNSVIIGIVSIIGYFITSGIINSIGNKNILVFGLFISGSCGIFMYWAKDSLTTLILASIYITISSIASTALVGSVVAMFPTSTRTMIVSLTMMFGRSGAIIGNVLFPYLMSLGCLPPFIMIGAIVIVVSIISTFLPKTIKKPLQ